MAHVSPRQNVKVNFKVQQKALKVDVMTKNLDIKPKVCFLFDFVGEAPKFRDLYLSFNFFFKDTSQYDKYRIDAIYTSPLIERAREKYKRQLQQQAE